MYVGTHDHHLSNMTKLKQNKITGSITWLQEGPKQYIMDEVC
jgi:hypothetical protein